MLSFCLIPAGGCQLCTHSLPIPKYHCLLEGSFYACLVPRGHLLISWLWKPGACDPGSHGTVNIGESVLGRSPPHSAYLWSVCERGLFACLGASAQGVDFWFDTQLQVYRGALRNRGSAFGTSLSVIGHWLWWRRSG